MFKKLLEGFDEQIVAVEALLQRAPKDKTLLGILTRLRTSRNELAVLAAKESQ